MTTEQIRKKVSASKHWGIGSRFLGINGDQVLWYDSEERMYCINTFVIVDGKVEFSPMPIESYN